MSKHGPTSNTPNTTSQAKTGTNYGSNTKNK